MCYSGDGRLCGQWVAALLFYRRFDSRESRPQPTSRDPRVLGYLFWEVTAGD